MKRLIVMLITAMMAMLICVPANAELVTHYKLDGDGTDVTGNNNATVYGPTATVNRIGTPNSAMHFDGVDDYMAVTNPTGLDIGTAGELSISAWFKTDLSLSEFQGMIVSRVKYPAAFMLGCRANSAYFYLIDDDLVDLVSRDYFPTLTPGWHHVVGTYERLDEESSNIFIYIDGVLATEGFENYFGTMSFNSTPLAIGRWLTGSGEQYYFRGDLDDIRIYDHPLTASDVKALYYQMD